MLNKIIPAVVVIVGAIAGGFGAQMLSGSPAEATADASEVEGDSKDEKAKDDYGGDKDKKKDAKAGDYGDQKGGDYGGATTYFKFSREFVVPLMRDDKVKSLVILNINIEVDANATAGLFAQEPKLRDNIMMSLIELSHDGVTLDNITDVESFETIRSVLVKNLKKIAPEGIKNVLILDVGKQEL